ncbi:hypothetical protein [Parasitella parasitica]|uniref:Reverse transcriptase zinc-binding domain-containing protein n=1 Tax=Parasitella parasitica TaxID=35722 RepID=A0A0B7NNX6_9FUNG|nr:hypothetical protein [Parasitella parasitica]
MRRYWHPARDTITSRMGPPLILPVHLRLRPASWRLFWSLELPVKAFTPWWRMLHDRISHRSWLYRIVLEKVESPFCALCGVGEEDLYHFVVGCPLKADSWRDVMSLLSRQDLLPTSLAVWTTLSSLCFLDMVDLDDDVLVALGAGFVTLWKYHWRCVIDAEPWIPFGVLNMVQNDHNVLFFTLSLMAGGQAHNLALSDNNIASIYLQLNKDTLYIQKKHIGVTCRRVWLDRLLRRRALKIHGGSCMNKCLLRRSHIKVWAINVAVSVWGCA